MNQLKEYRNPRVCMAQQRAVLAAIGMTLFACLGCPAGAQDASSYPNKPVRIFVPYGAGGVGDLTMRLLTQKLSETAGQQFVIENKPGAGGSLSARGALAPAPDGYSLAMTGNGQAIAMTLFKARNYDVLTDFTQVSITATFDMLLAVKANWKNLKTFRTCWTSRTKTRGSSTLVRSILAARKICRLISSSKHRALMSPSCLTRRPRSGDGSSSRRHRLGI